MKKIFTLFAALMMVLSMFAANIPAGTKLYLTPNENWKMENARFAAYFFGNGEAWVSMTKVEGETDLYELTSPSKEFTNVIFCRMNPSASANNWNNKWNQTADLTYDGSLNHYTVKEGTWNKGGGTWSIWPIPAEKTYKDITITVVASATPKIHWWGAGDKLADSNWEARPEMTATGAENTYAYTLKEVDDVKGVNFIISVGDIQSADQHTTVDVTKNFKEFLPQVAVLGVNNWDGTDKMTVADDYLSASITLPLVANEAYALKLTVDGNWVGGSSVNITKDKNSASFAEDTGGDGKITTDIAGDYVFTYTYATKTLVVTYPEPTPTYDVTVVDATVSTGTWSIDLAGTWEERTVTIKLWQDNVQGFGEYAANAETGYTCQLGNPYAELTPTTVGLYADNGDGTFTFTATMTDTDGGIYNISVSGDNPVVEPETKELEGFTAFAKEEGSLSVAYEAEDWSWLLTLYIENYTGYGTYEVSDVYYGDVTGDYYGMSGSVTIGYDEDAETDVLTATLTTSDGSLIVLVTLYDKAATMPLMITNLRTEQVGAYLQLAGRNDMDDADVMLFLNDYTGEDKAYEVDTENSFMTYGGIELTVLDGSLTKSVHPEYGDMFTGVVNVYAEEDDMNLALELTMYAAPATNVVVVNAVATYDDNTGALTLKGVWEDEEVSVEIAGYDGKESVEYNTPQGILFKTPDVAAFGNEASITVAGEDITVVCTASSWTGDVYNVTITTLSKVGTALDNVTTTVAPVKAIVNGQLIIIKNGVQYNAQGAVVK